MSIDRLLLEGGSRVLQQSGGSVLLESSFMANVNEQWIGAVQPSEIGASGNQISLWIGAIEPAAQAGPVSSGRPKKPGFIDVDGSRNRRTNRYGQDQNDVTYRLGINDAPDIGTYDNKCRNRYS